MPGLKRRLLLATHNPHKAEEIRQMLPDWEILTLADVAYDLPIPENADTLTGNALVKAETVFGRFHMPVLADDTGLFVDALGGKPGVHTARYAGTEATSADNIRKLLRALQGKTHRTARFVTVMAYATESGRWCGKGILEGTIADQPQGEGGFGYDPVFVPQGYEKTLAQLPREEKNRISHRRRAIDRWLRFLRRNLF